MNFCNISRFSSYRVTLKYVARRNLSSSSFRLFNSLMVIPRASYKSIPSGLQSLSYGSRSLSGSAIKSWIYGNDKESLRQSGLPSESTLTDNAADISPTDFIQEAPEISGVDFLPEAPIIDMALNHLGEPTFASLGLGGWWPPGLIQTALEFLHVNAGMSWCSCIVLSTLVFRLALFPLVIKLRRATITYSNHAPTIQGLQQRILKAHGQKNRDEVFNTHMEMQDYIKRNNIDMWQLIKLPLLQAPFFLSMFFGLKEMAQLPVHSLTMGGMLWFTNLTVPDPYFVLPLLTSSLIALMMRVGADMPQLTTQMPFMKYMIPAMPILTFFFICSFPADLTLYWTFNNIFSLFQNMFLRLPQVKKALNMPEEIKHINLNSFPKAKFMDDFKKSMDLVKELQGIELRDQMENERKRNIHKAPQIQLKKKDKSST